MPGALEARRRRSEAAFYPLFRGVVRAPGIFAALTPELPEGSLFNAAVYDDLEALVGAYDDVAELYASRGVRAWTVWVHLGDQPVADALAERGHVLDGTPQSMGAWLRALDRPATTSGSRCRG